jgi:hypothetical protein
MRVTFFFYTGVGESCTNVENPAETDGRDDTAIVERLDPQCENETAKCTDKEFGLSPKEDRDGATTDTSNETREDKKASQGLTGWAD